MHAFDRQMDGRTDRILIARPRLHSTQHGKNLHYLPMVRDDDDDEHDEYLTQLYNTVE